MKYTYQGRDEFIPGLPLEITDEEAAARGLQDLLAAAIANGSYAPLDSIEANERAGYAPQRESVETSEPYSRRRAARSENEESQP